MNYKSVFRLASTWFTPFQNQSVHTTVASPELASVKHITPICLLP